MRKWALFFLLVVVFKSAIGQAIHSGRGVSSGYGESGVTNSGAPLVYAARTDGCVSVALTPTACNGSKTTGESQAPLAFMGGNSDPLPFKRLDDPTTPAVMNTSFTDPDFGTYEVFATDEANNCTGNTTANLDFGSDGNHVAFGWGSPNDVMMTYQSDGGKSCLDHIVESRLLAKTCSPSNPCVVPSSLTQNTTCTETDQNYGSGSNCTNQQYGGPAVFSRNHSDPPNTFFDLDLPSIWKTLVNAGMSSGIPTGSDTLTRVLWVNFSTDGDGLTSVPCKVMPTDYQMTWHGTFNTGVDGSIGIATGGGGSYQTINQQPGVTGSGPTYTVPTTVFVMPVNNISGIANFMFQVTTAGTISGTEPNWSANCPAQGNMCTDGTAVWTNIGKVNGQAPGFDVWHFDPHRGCSHYNTRLSYIWRGTNEGPNWPSSGTPDPSGPIYSDDVVTIDRLGGNASTVAVKWDVPYVLHDANQTIYGQYTRVSATGGDGPNTDYGTSPSSNAGGTYWTLTPVPTGDCFGVNMHTQFPNWNSTWPNQVWVSGTTYAANAMAVDPTDHNYYQTVAGVASDTVQPHADATNWALANNYCGGHFVDWNTSKTVAGVGLVPVAIRPQLQGGPDWGSGGSHPISGNSAYGGGQYWAHAWAEPNCNTQDATIPCDYIGAPNPSQKMLSAWLPSDAHPSYNQVQPPSDVWPMFLPTSAVPNSGCATNAGGCVAATPCTSTVQTDCNNYVAPGYGEILGVQPFGGSNPTEYRFGHNFGDGSEPSFSGQNTIGVISQDGLILGYGSPFMGTRGDAVVNNSTTCQCSNSGGTQNASYCGTSSQVLAGGGNLHANYQWLKNSAVTAGDLSMVISDNQIYKASGSGTSGSVNPFKPDPCKNGTPGTCTVTDNTVTWVLQGQNSCRIDIAIMALQSAQPAP